MDDLVLDAETLYKLADVIRGYCERQQEILDAYYARIMTLASEWRDDETFGTIAEEIRTLRARAVSVLEEINQIYPAYFREKAEWILRRPFMPGDGQGPLYSGGGGYTGSVGTGSVGTGYGTGYGSSYRTAGTVSGIGGGTGAMGAYTGMQSRGGMNGGNSMQSSAGTAAGAGSSAGYAQTARDKMMNYMAARNYGAEDSAVYRKDPEWQALNESLMAEIRANGSKSGSPQTAQQKMMAYLAEHHYGREDSAVYRKDPEWQELNERLTEEIAAEGSPERQEADREKAEAIQAQHRPFIRERSDVIGTIIGDIQSGSGPDISVGYAGVVQNAVEDYSSERYVGIRSAYRNSKAGRYDREQLKALDLYLKWAPKWCGRVYRGINVSAEAAEKILSAPYIDMLGPSSWSSEVTVAKKYADKGDAPVRMLFVLKDNLSGVSITHLASYDGKDSEVTAPSGVRYYVEDAESATVQGTRWIYVHVSEKPGKGKA